MTEKKISKSTRTFVTPIPVAVKPPPKDRLSIDEETKEYLEKRKKSVLEQARIAEVEKITAQEQLDTAKLMKEKQDVEKQGSTGKKTLTDEEKSREDKIWQIDSEKLRPRPAKEGEPGMTLDQAREVLKEMRKMEEPPLVIFNEQMGKYVPNPESEFVKKNPDAAWAAARDYDKKLQAGEEADPMDIFTQRVAQVDEFKKRLGITNDTPKTDGGLGNLDALDKYGLLRKPGTESQETITYLKERIERLEKEPKENENLKALREELKAERETRQREKEAEMAALREENRALRARPAPGKKDEVDIIYQGIEKIDGGLNNLGNKIEKGLEAFKSGKPINIPATLKDKQAVTQKITEESARNQRLSQLEDELFLKKSPVPTPPPEPSAPPPPPPVTPPPAPPPAGTSLGKIEYK